MEGVHIRMKWVFGAVLAFAALQLAVVTACGQSANSGDDSGDFQSSSSRESAAATPAPAPASEIPRPTGIPSPDDFVPSQESSANGGGKVQPAPLAQNRIIVHTARMSLVVDDVAHTVNSIVDLAGELGGWVVSSDRSSRHSGAIAIRVPAEFLDKALGQLEALAADVESLVVTSEDVTDEYVDNKARLVSLRATEERLLSFLDRAADVEDALQVQKEISDLQLRIEETKGRLNFLSQTAAYSLIETKLKLAAVTMVMDPGPDRSVRVGETARFRASFTPPPGIDEFSFVWDFGDGGSITGSGSAPTQGGKRLTATVNHAYEDDRDSPYIVTVNMTGTGEGGIATGSKSLEVSVRQVPTIEVFAGEPRTVEEGKEEDYNASFTRHTELWDYQYLWDFGDGSPTLTGTPGEGFTRVETTRVFADYRPMEYIATLTVTAMSDAGQVSGTDSFSVRVTEAESFFVGGWNVGGTAKAAVRALSVLAKAATTVVIWLAIVGSPVILVGLVGLVILYFGNRGARRVRRFFPQRAPKPETLTPGTLSEEPPSA